MNVGFIGLGRMGQGMALSLARAGTSLVVHDINEDAAAPVIEAGASWAPSTAEVVRQVDVLFTSLPGPVQFEAVVEGADGVLDNLRPGFTLFDLSTNSLTVVRRLHSVFEQRGAALLDSPVSGGPAGAASGDLALWVGGDRIVFDRHEQLLLTIGKAPRYVGGIGTGTVTKLAHNMMAYTILLAMAEQFSVAVKAGMDPLELWKALQLGVVGRGSPLNMLVKQFLPGEFETPAFALNLAFKDVTLATDMAKELGVPSRLANSTMQDMMEALARGFGDQDSRAYLKLQLERAGVEMAVPHELIEQAMRGG